MLKRLLVVLFVGFSTFANASEPKQALDAFHAALATGDTATATATAYAGKPSKELPKASISPL